MSDREGVEKALQIARRRLDETASHSPSWAAAIEAVQELERRLKRLDDDAALDDADEDSPA